MPAESPHLRAAAVIALGGVVKDLVLSQLAARGAMHGCVYSPGDLVCVRAPGWLVRALSEVEGLSVPTILGVELVEATVDTIDAVFGERELVLTDEQQAWFREHGLEIAADRDDGLPQVFHALWCRAGLVSTMCNSERVDLGSSRPAVGTGSMRRIDARVTCPACIVALRRRGLP